MAFGRGLERLRIALVRSGHVAVSDVHQSQWPLEALDADDGTVLWETIVGGMIVNSTITYAVDGKQYVMVFTGEGRSATSGPLRVAADSMPKPVRRHNSIYVFALP